jgi:predicted AlkP superfamily pyrophosphatase or phosphodiesterase
LLVKPLVLVVIDGLTPSMLERAVERPLPALAALADAGGYGRATSTFPSLTPVCLSSIATGAHPDVHEIPHLVWYHRDERRIVEYGSSFGALRAAGTRRSILDAIFNMNAEHLGADAVTLFEALEDAGYTTAAVNMTCYRGRTTHRPLVPGLGRVAHGPKRFFYYSLFESDRTGAPIAVRSRAEGSVDAYAAAVGRWLVTRDGFDFLVYYLPDYDFASHAAGPDAADAALARSDAAVGALFAAAGGPDEFLERYAVILLADHGQTHVDRAVRLQDAFGDFHLFSRSKADAELAVTASNRAGMVYVLPDCSTEPRRLAERLDEYSAVEAALFLENGQAVLRREGEELCFARDGDGWKTSGDEALVADCPDALARAWAALHDPNAGELLVSAAPGVEFADLAGRHHAGGGSHGSLVAGDSIVPVLTVGVDAAPASIVDVAPAVLAHFGVEAPAYMRAEVRVG